MVRCISVVIPLLCFSFIALHSDAAPRCSRCIDGTCPPPRNCTYGIVKDYCGRDVCAKGPGQRCGGRWNYHGSCGDGMFCSCDRCTGCSLRTLECYSETCI